MAHRYNFWDIIGWWLHGLEQRVRVLVPDWIIQTTPETSSIPDFWWDHWGWREWHDNLDDDFRPNASWVWYWQTAIRQTLAGWIEEVGEWARDAAVDLVRQFTGYVLHDYPTFSSWIEAIRNRVGSWVPPFASSLASGLNHVWNLIPQGIRDGLQSFTGWLDAAIQDAKEWVRTTYDNAKQLAINAWNWITSAGQTLKGWWDAAHVWLDDLRANFVARVTGALGSVWDWLVSFWNAPYQTVAGWLGTPWQKVLTFAQGAFQFWYNLWSENADDLGEFLIQPFWFIYERVESWIIDNIW